MRRLRGRPQLKRRSLDGANGSDLMTARFRSVALNVSVHHHLTLLAMAVLTASLVRPCSGQRLAHPLPSLARPAADANGSLGGSVAGGLVLGGGGFLTGAFAGLALAQGCSSEFCGWRAAFYGAAVGGTLGMAAGVHLGNGRRGSFLLDCLAAAGVWTIGIGITAASHWDATVTPIAFVTIPLAQMAATIGIERLTSASTTEP